MIGQAFERLRDSWTLVLYPIAFDLAALWGRIGLFGFHGESKFSLKLTLDAGLPSIANLIDQKLGGGGLSLGAIIAMNIIFGILVNSFWSRGVLLATTIAYGIIATGLQLALMMSLHQVLFGGSHQRESVHEAEMDG